MMQQVMGVTLQRHDILGVQIPEHGHNQRRLPEEVTAQEWRDDTLRLLTPPVVQLPLPQEPTCVFWQNVSASLG